MSVKITGFDKLQNRLKQMEKGIKELEGHNHVSFDDLFTSEFMWKYTNFSSLDELLNAGNFKVQSQEDFESIPENELDSHIASTTKFKSWENMLSEATSQYAIKKLGF